MHHHADLYAILPLSALALLTTLSALSNPYSRMSRVRNPFETKLAHGRITLTKRFDLSVRRSLFWRLFAYGKCGWHIVSNVRAGSRAKSKTREGIIRDIHRVRFNPKRPYVISGDHFNVFYPRNLGVFYYAMIDPRTALSPADFEHRQRLYLQSAAYAIAAFAEHGDCTTTIVPVGERAVCCINFYTYPSDALYGILFALAVLRDDRVFCERFPFTPAAAPAPVTKDAAEALLSERRATLELLLQKYVVHVYDFETGLIKTNVRISSAKDITIREGAFYDNVIVWKTLSLADELGLTRPDINLPQLKARILTAFWREQDGFFLEDQSRAAASEGYYSADWLTAFFTGFLDANVPAEVTYLRRAVGYTMRQNLDLPFPLRYQGEDRASRQYPLVRLVVPSYGGTSIWSFWGAEFIKLLVVLYRHTGNETYLARAGQHVETYEKNMEQYRGYPEVYNTDGGMLNTPLYKSVRQTGWVVGFEQAAAMYRAATEITEAAKN